jgi:hypothetical protein
LRQKSIKSFALLGIPQPTVIESKLASAVPRSPEATAVTFNGRGVHQFAKQLVAGELPSFTPPPFAPRS